MGAVMQNYETPATFPNYFPQKILAKNAKLPIMKRNVIIAQQCARRCRRRKIKAALRIAECELDIRLARLFLRG